MKRLNKKLLTFVLAGACAASLCAATINVISSADEAEGVAYSSVFAPTVTDGGKVEVETATGAETGTLRFTLENGKSAYLKRDLALKWFAEEEDAVTEKYMSMKFSFKDQNFKKVTFTMESASSVVTEEDKAVNTIAFEMTEGVMYAVVNGDATNKTQINGTDVELSLAKATAPDDHFGSFDVKVNGTKVGAFKNIGANYADYALEKTLPLTISAETDADKSAVILFKELNGQKFDEIENDLITDTAAPVLVVNEEISSLQHGTAFTLNYEKIDVLQDSNLKEDKYFYQYSPAHEEVKYESPLSTSTYFLSTTYYTDGTKFYEKNNAEETYTEKSVMAEEGREYVSIKITLGDKKNTEDYYLSWYATAGSTVSKTVNGTAVDCIVVDKNEDGPQYAFLIADGGKNKYTVDGATVAADQVAAEGEYETAIGEYQVLLDEAASKIKASSSSSINLPALDWLIKDNGGYRGLRFTVSYRTPSSGSAKSATSLLYNGLKFTTSEEGVYEFKVFANDTAGNTMSYYNEDGELVELTATNVWDIDEIKSFKFTVADNPISVKKPTKDTDKRVEKLLDQTYTLSGITVEGATSEKNAYALYRFDDSKYAGTITEATLLKVGYDEIITAATAEFAEVGGAKYGNYFDLYVHVYAKEIARLVKGSTPDEAEIKAVEDCFVRIEEYNAEITEDNDKDAWEAYNKYNWNPTTKSFKTVEEGNYFIFADYYEDYLPSQRATAYKMIIVESKADVIKGESQFSAWVKNNVVSVILFGVAGLMLIAIVILLLVQPSDETLEDVDEVAKKKNKKDE